MSRISQLCELGKLPGVPQFACKPSYEVITGSFAYGISGDASDVDIYAVTVPPLDMIYPHLTGMVPGFGPHPSTFNNIQMHAITHNEKVYDVSIYGIVKFFELCADCNPNMIDTLFVPDRCILHADSVGKIIRENRKLFLHAGAYHRFKGYAYSQLKKLETKKPTGKRVALVETYGYDTKFAYHLIRLLNECIQILLECDLNLEANNEELKAIRNGDFSLEKLKEKFDSLITLVDVAYTRTALPYTPDYRKLNDVLVSCIEEKYGTLSNAIAKRSDSDHKILKIKEILALK